MGINQFFVGVISDTHGLIRPQVMDVFKGVNAILHAGDIGGPDILEQLQKIAPVFSVRGNMDGSWASQMPRTEVVELETSYLYMLHNLNMLDLDPKGANFQAVIFGHTHQPFHSIKDDVLYFNPGSAGPRRFNYPISVGLMTINGSNLDARIVELDDVY